MHFLRVNVTFYDAVNVIHEIITTGNPITYTAKFIHSVGRNDNFLAKARKLSILPTSLDIFDIRQYYRPIRILYIHHQYSKDCFNYSHYLQYTMIVSVDVTFYLSPNSAQL